MSGLNSRTNMFVITGRTPTQRTIYCDLRDLQRGTSSFRWQMARFEYGAGRSMMINSADIFLIKNLSGPERSAFIHGLTGNIKEEVRPFYEALFGTVREVQSRSALRENDYVANCTSTGPFSDTQVSNKGNILIGLYQDMYPVPDFSILTSDTYRLKGKQREQQIQTALQNLEKLSMLVLNDPAKPLLFAIREAMPLYLPGVMPTYLNVGITETTIPSVIAMFGENAGKRTVYNGLKAVACGLGLNAPDVNNDINSAIDKVMCDIRVVNRDLIEDPFCQASFLINKAYEMHGGKSDLLRNFSGEDVHFPSLILQQMVFPVITEDSFSGVMYSRHPRTGEGRELKVGRSLFGDEIMTGEANAITTPFSSGKQINRKHIGSGYISELVPFLEEKFRSPVTVELAVQNGLAAILQVNPSALSGPATFNAVMDMRNSGMISDSDVIELIKPYHIRQIESPRIDPSSFKDLEVFCPGVSILPRSAVTGRACFSEEEALQLKAKGDNVILIKDSFEPDDIEIMSKVDGLISLTPSAIHVVTSCRANGIPGLVDLRRSGARLGISKSGPRPASLFQSGDGGALVEIFTGDWITISSKNQVLYKGMARYEESILMRLIKGEDVKISGQKESSLYRKIAKAYGQYKEMTASDDASDLINSNLKLFQVIEHDLGRGSEHATRMANAWYQKNKESYIDQVFESSLGDHKMQTVIFEHLTQENKIDALRTMISRCKQESSKGYEATRFVIGRLMTRVYPVTFWKAFSVEETVFLISEWIMGQKYNDILQEVGERNTNKAREIILKRGLGRINLHSGNISDFMTLKLSLPDWEALKSASVSSKLLDPQTKDFISLLKLPYGSHYDFNSKYGYVLDGLRNLCAANGVSMPKAEDK